MADAIDLQSLLDKLADFLLQSGFAGGKMQNPYWDDAGQEQDRSMDALREAILNALMDSGQFTAEMLEALRGDGKDDGESAEKLAKLLDDIISKLVEEGYLNVDAPPQMPAGHQPVTGPGGLALNVLARQAQPVIRWPAAGAAGSISACSRVTAMPRSRARPARSASNSASSS